VWADMRRTYEIGKYRLSRDAIVDRLFGAGIKQG
jgi:hypothetical protein